MNIEFIGKEKTFDDVIYTWSIQSKVNSYNLIIEFIGGLDENGEENLYNSSFADISLHEVDHHDKGLLDEIAALISNDIEIETYTDTVMISAPDIRESITTRNESSFDDTLSDYNKILFAATGVLLLHEMGSEALV